MRVSSCLCISKMPIRRKTPRRTCPSSSATLSNSKPPRDLFLKKPTQYKPYPPSENDSTSTSSRTLDVPWVRRSSLSPGGRNTLLFTIMTQLPARTLLSLALWSFSRFRVPQTIKNPEASWPASSTVAGRVETWMTFRRAMELPSKSPILPCSLMITYETVESLSTCPLWSDSPPSCLIKRSSAPASGIWRGAVPGPLNLLRFMRPSTAAQLKDGT